MKRPDPTTVARHEASHAVMRWLCGLEQTDILVRKDLSGYCEGTGKTIRVQDEMLILLAGFAYEAGYGLSKVNFAKSRCDDLERAREILKRCRFLRTRIVVPDVMPPPGTEIECVVEEVEEALERWFKETCKRLLPYAYAVEELGEALLDAPERGGVRVLSSRKVARILGRPEYREKRLG